jgi:hypothetical protein
MRENADGKEERVERNGRVSCSCFQARCLGDFFCCVLGHGIIYYTNKGAKIGRWELRNSKPTPKAEGNWHRTSLYFRFR